MQHKYVGDIGDYSKFVLIKHLFDKKCGLIWYLYPNENNNDGCHIDYDNYNLKEKFIAKILKETICENRNIATLEKKLQENGFDLIFFNKCIEGNNCNFLHYTKRENFRKKWFEEALEQVKNCTVVFVDPDNGIVPDSYENKTRDKRSGKYIYYKEIESLFNLKNLQTLVIYQHFTRKGSDIFINELEKKLKEKLTNIKFNFNFYVIKFKRKSLRAYLILSKKDLKDKIENFCNKFNNEFELLKVSYAKSNN